MRTKDKELAEEQSPSNPDEPVDNTRTFSQSV